MGNRRQVSLSMQTKGKALSSTENSSACWYAMFFDCFVLMLRSHACANIYLIMHMYVCLAIPLITTAAVEVTVRSFFSTFCCCSNYYDICAFSFLFLPNVDLHIYLHTSIYACVYATYVCIFVETCSSITHIPSFSLCDTFQG